MRVGVLCALRIKDPLHHRILRRNVENFFRQLRGTRYTSLCNLSPNFVEGIDGFHVTSQKFKIKARGLALCCVLYIIIRSTYKNF